MKTDIIEITTTAKQNEGTWTAEVKGYPITGEGRTATAAIEDAADGLRQLFEAHFGGPRQNVEVRTETLSQKVLFTIELEDARQTTLFEVAVPEADKA